jgi:nucleoside-diphosphate-sugar epimerase
MRYLVTGGAGFIGSNIVKELVKRGEQVRILDNFSTGRRENIREFGSDIEVIDGDIRDFWVTLHACDGVDYVLHQAALPSVNRSVENPLTSNDVNANGTLTVLECARRQGVKKLLFASSSSVYGDTPTLPKLEDMMPNPLSPYAISKLTGEYYCRVYANLYDFPAIAFRYFNVFGPNQNPDSDYAAVIPKFIKLLLHDQSPVFFGDGLQSRDFTYIDNVVSAVLLACKQDKVKCGEFNLACGGQYTLRDLVQQLNDLLGKNIPAKQSEPRPGDIKHSYADVSKVEREMGIKPIVSFSEGLQKTIAYYQSEAC